MLGFAIQGGNGSGRRSGCGDRGRSRKRIGCIGRGSGHWPAVRGGIHHIMFPLPELRRSIASPAEGCAQAKSGNSVERPSTSTISGGPESWAATDGDSIQQREFSGGTRLKKVGREGSGNGL